MSIMRRRLIWGMITGVCLAIVSLHSTAMADYSTGKVLSLTNIEGISATPSNATSSNALLTEQMGSSIVISGVMPGQLKTFIEANPQFVSEEKIRDLTVSGILGSSDYHYINMNLSRLETLDLSDVDNATIPTYAFAN
ncbi:hypothetical protein EcloH_4515, partial [Enterobacter ludwigii]